jgi:hypothetical protein
MPIPAAFFPATPCHSAVPAFHMFHPAAEYPVSSRTTYILIFNTIPDFIKYRPSCSSAGLSGSLFDASEHDDKIKNCAP